MNILISGRLTGRIASDLSNCLNYLKHNVSFQDDIFNHEGSERLSSYDVYIATAWNTKGNYKEDPINEKYAESTIYWLDKCKELNVYSIYLGTSDNSGFEDCLYRRCKDRCDSHANTVIKIPYLWQPSREGSLAWKVERGEKYNITTDKKVVYTTEGCVTKAVLECLDYWFSKNQCISKVEWSDNAMPLEYWIKNFSLGVK